MSKKINKIAKNLLAFGIISSVPTMTNVVNANANNDLEAEFLSVVDKYDSENIIVENGVVIRNGETLDLSSNPNWELSNNNTVKISENGIVTPISTGTVFLSQEIGDSVHIIEVSVSDNTMSYKGSSRSNIVDRNYYKVFVDPGHGGSDNGASGNGNLEDELNLQISLKVESKLKAKGIQVKMSRYSDTYVSLSQRAKMANSYGADVFVSIHQNSASANSANGIETYYHSKKSYHKPYAADIQANAIQETGAKNRGVKSANFSVLREANMTSALFESGFINNPTESKKLADPVYQDKLAQGIVDGIENYLKENIKLTGEPVLPEFPEEELEVIKSGEITASSLNVRNGYGTSYAKIGSLTKGSKVEIVEEKDGWYKIKYNGGYGYISADYVKITSEETNPPITPEVPEEKPEVIKSGEVSASSLNVRSGYGTSYSKIGSLVKGSKVEIVEEKNGWYKIKYNGGYGYISADYVKITSGETNPPTTPEVPEEKPENPPIETPEIIKNGEVSASSLNVRSGYGTSYSKIGSLAKGSKVEIVEEKNGWYKIKYNGGYGYISAEYVKITSGETNPPTTPEVPEEKPNVVKSGKVTASSLNVRSGYGTSYSKIGSLAKGTKVEIVESKNGWHKIKFNGGYGYVSSDYISIENNSSNTPSEVIKKGKVNASKLNVRSGYGTSNTVIGSLSRGAVVEIVESKSGWYKIKFNKTYGYVSGDYITII